MISQFTFISWRTVLACCAAISILPNHSLGFEQPSIGGQITGELGSYVVRNGVPSWLPPSLENGHAGILYTVRHDESATRVFEIRGLGQYVTMSKFASNETWGTDSFLEANQFKGCGHSPFCEGLSPLDEQEYREEVIAQAARCIGVPYLSSFDFAMGIHWVNPDLATYGITALDANGEPIVPISLRCDGLMEWAFEAAQAKVTGATGASVDPNWGVYKAFGSVNDGYKSTPRGLWQPYGATTYVHTYSSIPDLPNMAESGLVSEPIVSSKTYSVTWSEPFDLSGIFKYAYGWVPVGQHLDPSQPGTLTVSTAPESTPLTGDMPAAPGTYRFVVKAMDKLGHWSGAAQTYESVPRAWPPAIAAPTILVQPASQTAYLGQSVTFSVSASGVAPLSYQWMESGIDIPSATNSTLTIANVTEVDNGRSFSVRVTNPQGSATSTPAVLTISTSLDTGEPNDSSLTGTPLPVGIARNGYIGSPTDVDWFKVIVDKTGLLTVNLTVPSGMDYDLEIYGPDFIWKSGSYGLAGQNESINLSLLQTGTYYVRVYGYPVGAGAFDINRPYMVSASLEVAASGVINTPVTWAETVELTGDVVIGPGGSLTILPGTQIRIPKSDDQAGGNNANITEIILDGGTLTAEGTEVSPIVFTSSRTPKTAGDWYGIRVKNGNVSLQHCVLEYAAEGIRFEDTDTRFETYALSDVTVRYCTGNGVWTTSGQYAQPVVLNDFKVIGCGTGLRAEGPVTMTGGEISNSTGDGFYVYYTTVSLNGVSVRVSGSHGIEAIFSSTTLAGCTVSYNQGRGLQSNYGPINVTGCTFAYNGSWAVEATWSTSSSAGRTAELSGNVVQNNGGGIYLRSTATIGLANNTISANTGVGLDLYLASDYGTAGLSATGITGNSIFGNGGVGVRVRGNQPPVLTLSGNDIYNNTGFELRNESSCTVVADGNYWGEPTGTELANGAPNLTRIYDLRDGASRAVMLTAWYAASVVGGNPGPLQNYDYPLPGVTHTVAGVIAGTETWSGKVLVIGDVTVTGSLDIEPGTEVVFEHLHDTQTGGNDTSRSELILDGGTLTAEGTEVSPIVFTSSRTPKTAGDWYGIRVKNGNVSLQHCVLEYAAEGIRFEDTDTRFETYALSDVTVRYCTGNGVWTTSGQYAQPVVLNDFKVIGCGTGLRAEGPVTMTGGEISNSTGDGFYVYYTTVSLNGVSVRVSGSHGIEAIFSSTTLAGCTVSYNQGRGLQSNYGPINVTGCTFAYNGSWAVEATWSTSSSAGRTAELSGNVVQNNGGGIYLRSTATIGLANNTISANTGVGLDLYLASDYGTAGLSATGITGNSIFGNGGVGVRVRGNQPPVLTLSGNDIYNNTGFELRNESSCTVVADGNYWGEPTGTELANGAPNLTRIYDLRDGASRQVQIGNWYPASFLSGNPGDRIDFTYGVSNITKIVQGAITADDTWHGRILIVGDVILSANLTIEEGTEVILVAQNDTQTGGNDTSRSELILDGGTLTAEGTEVSPIVFTSSRTPKTAGDWYGIRVKNGNVSLQHCVLEYAAEGIRFEDTDTRFETYALSDVTVRYCTGNGVWTTSGQYAQPVVLNDFKVIGCGTGLRAEGPVTMTGGEISNSTGDGFYVYYTTVSLNGVSVRVSGSHGIEAIFSSTTLAGCTVSYNQGRGLQSNYGPINVTGCTFAYNGSWAVEATWSTSSSAGRTAELSGNVVQNNGGGIYLRSTATIGLANNTISANTGVGLDLYLASDYGTAGLSATGITGNSIFGNGGVGVRVRGNQPPVLTLSGNDIYNNTGFELRNESSCTVVADGNYWGEPTGTELANGAPNLTRIYDLRDGASRAVMLTAWYAASVVGGNPGPLQNYDYPLPGVTHTVAGVIAGTETWSGKVLVIGDVTVTGSLDIEPGTEVVFEHLHDTQTGGNDTSRSELILDGGTLTAEGTEVSPIVFTSSRTPKTAGDWYGIRVKNGNVSLQHCVLEYAAEGIRFEDTDTRFETYALSDVTVRYCTGNGVWTTSGQYAQPVVLNDFKVIGCGTGLRAEGPVTMTGGEISNSTGDGFYVYYTTVSLNGVSVRVSGSHGIEAIFSSTTLAGCTVSYNQGRGLQSNYGPINVTGCTFAYNGSWAVEATWSTSSSAGRTAELSGNVVQNNGGGIYLRSTATIGLANNTISANTGVGLDLYLASDYGTAGLSATGITGNSIFGNGGVGVRVRGNQPPVLTLSGNDIYNNTGFEIRNESAISITAENVYLGKETATEFGKQANLSRS
jgi:parallel beta-helix repeat protein